MESVVTTSLTDVKHVTKSARQRVLLWWKDTEAYYRVFAVLIRRVPSIHIDLGVRALLLDYGRFYMVHHPL